MEYLLLIIVALVFSAACSCQFRWKFGARFCKRKIPENSVWRKIYPFKENEKKSTIVCKMDSSCNNIYYSNRVFNTLHRVLDISFVTVRLFGIQIVFLDCPYLS